MRISGLWDSLGLPDYTNTDFGVTAPASNPVETAPVQSASGSSGISEVGDTLLNAFKTALGYNLQKDQLEVQKIAAQRGGYYPVATQTAYPQTRTVTQIAGSNMMPILLIAGIGVAAFMVLKK